MNRLKVNPTNISERKNIAFVSQSDSLQPTSTTKEAIAFSAKLRLPRITTDAEIKDLTEKMIAELGLEDCADTMIGGELVKGISGGERKRVSIGVELVTKPSLVFLDEPTSGLDSISALQVMNVLKKIACAGCSVMFTIHQPLSEVFASFDNLILLHQGVVMYQGPVSECPEYFANHNYPVPKHYNPADWIMSVAQKYSQERLIAENFCTRKQVALTVDDTVANEEFRASFCAGRHLGISDNEWKHVTFFTEVRLLFAREFANTIRSKLVRARFALTTFISLLVGCIFYDVGSGSDINSHFGAMVSSIFLSLLCH
jgi:ABC-type multidrug transport system ATPase subunit